MVIIYKVILMQLDLNLLTSLDALLEEGSVGAAADRLHLTAPAMSRALGRIRSITGDQILVRTGHAMVPTPHALAVHAEVHDLVLRAHAVLEPHRGLDLATLERTFTLRCHDAITSAIGAQLLAAVESQAPGVTLRLLAEESVDTAELRRGEVDLQVGSTVPAGADVRVESAGSSRLVAVVRPGHPLTNGRMTAARFAAARHVTVSRRGRLSDPVDAALAELGLARGVVASAATSTAALHFVRGSDLVVVVPEGACSAMIGLLGLTTLPVPVELASIDVLIAWHGRYDRDLAHRWLRGSVRDALLAVTGRDGGSATSSPAIPARDEG